jgi:hypothetical protein
VLPESPNVIPLYTSGVKRNGVCFSGGGTYHYVASESWIDPGLAGQRRPRFQFRRVRWRLRGQPEPQGKVAAAVEYGQQATDTWRQVIASAIELTFDDSLPCPLKAQASTVVV